MDTKPKTIGADPAEAASGGLDGKKLRLIAIGVIAALVIGFGYMIWRALDESSRLERWDTLEALRIKHEPVQDPLWMNPQGVYNPERERYVNALEIFLDGQAKEKDDALEPQTRFLIAKTLADHILANPGSLDQEKRAEWYAKAEKQLQAIRDKHPDFPLNWAMLSEDGFPSLTRQFLGWLKDNQEWEKEYMLRPMDVDAGTRVLIRTTRGDMLMGLYATYAPAWSAGFVERASNGYYDGMKFVEKRNVGDASEPGEHGFRLGAPGSRDAKDFDLMAADKLSKKGARAGTMPEPSRNRIPIDRGVVTAWHKGGEAYDTDALFMVITSRSPYLDYKYTPIGKLVDENGIESVLTSDRIFNGEVWRTDDEARENSEFANILTWFQTPAQIVKVLVYKDGALVSATTAAETKAAIEDSERKLSTIKADRYKVDAPAAPAIKDDGVKDDGGKDDGGKGDDEDKDKKDEDEKEDEEDK